MSVRIPGGHFGITQSAPVSTIRWLVRIGLIFFLPPLAVLVFSCIEHERVTGFSTRLNGLIALYFLPGFLALGGTLLMLALLLASLPDTIEKRMGYGIPFGYDLPLYRKLAITGAVFLLLCFQGVAILLILLSSTVLFLDPLQADWVRVPFGIAFCMMTGGFFLGLPILLLSLLMNLCQSR